MGKALVAKSYENYEQVTEPYMVDGRQYVKVRTPKGIIKQVRAYTEAEYRKYNPEVKIIQPAKSKRDIYGFGPEGFLWIFKGDTYAAIDWFKENGAKYNKVWGWAFSSTVELPDPIPVGLEAVKLTWEQVSSDGINLNDEREMKKTVDALRYEPSTSDYVGDIGDKIELDLVCQRAVATSGYYGTQFFHTFTDSCGNVFVWSTTTKQLESGIEYHVKGTVKDHSMYRNTKQTVLKRCTISRI